MAHTYESMYKKRFSFGANWQKYLRGINEEKIAFAQRSLSDFLGKKSLKNQVFLDIGCGSGLFSLCALRLGAAQVISVDVDTNSIACAKYLRKHYGIPESRWVIQKGSALDKTFLASLPPADIVYSWGVLHHTGDMYSAIDNVISICKKNALLYIAIYNDFKGVPSSKFWWHVKKFYSARGTAVRTALKGAFVSYFTLGMLAHGKNPVRYIHTYPQHSVRGMDFYRDVEDWLGGYPYEYATVAQIKKYVGKHGFAVKNVRKSARDGCNEFLFKKQ